MDISTARRPARHGGRTAQRRLWREPLLRPSLEALSCHDLRSCDLLQQRASVADIPALKNGADRVQQLARIGCRAMSPLLTRLRADQFVQAINCTAGEIGQSSATARAAASSLSPASRQAPCPACPCRPAQRRLTCRRRCTNPAQARRDEAANVSIWGKAVVRDEIGCPIFRMKSEKAWAAKLRPRWLIASSAKLCEFSN